MLNQLRAVVIYIETLFFPLYLYLFKHQHLRFTARAISTQPILPRFTAVDIIIAPAALLIFPISFTALAHFSITQSII